MAALLAAAREVGFPPGISGALAALALVEWRAGEYARAADYAREGAAAAARVEESEALAYCTAVLGLSAGALERREEASRWLIHTLEDPRGLTLASRAIAFILDGYAAIIARDDPVMAIRRLGAVDTLRRAPGRATGVAFAASALSSSDLCARVSETHFPEVTAAAFDEGAADPDTVVPVILGEVEAVPKR